MPLNPPSCRNMWIVTTTINQWECTTRVTAPTKYRSSPHNRPTDSQPTATTRWLSKSSSDVCELWKLSMRRVESKNDTWGPGKCTLLTPAYCRPDISIPFAKQAQNICNFVGRNQHCSPLNISFGVLGWAALPQQIHSWATKSLSSCPVRTLLSSTNVK